MASSKGKFQTKEDWHKARELEAARKAGTAPAEVDEEGNEINPHIPKYIADAPWYLDTGAPSLKHQKSATTGLGSTLPAGEELGGYGASQGFGAGKSATMGRWYRRGAKKGPAATKYRKGACENCGAMTHRRKDCVERPRKVGLAS
jgi:pre-mRNA-processing factor SLU7